MDIELANQNEPETIDTIQKKIETKMQEFKIRKRILLERFKVLDKNASVIRKDPAFLASKFFKSQIFQSFVTDGKDLID